MESYIDANLIYILHFPFHAYFTYLSHTSTSLDYDYFDSFDLNTYTLYFLNYLNLPRVLIMFRTKGTYVRITATSYKSVKIGVKSMHHVFKGPYEYGMVDRIHIS
jgi:hypothetical protein